MARRIRKVETKARGHRRISFAEEILQQKPERAERTRAGMVDRLEGAVEAAWKASKENPELRTGARIAKGLGRSRALRWKLAMSGQHCARWGAPNRGSLMDEQDLVQEGYIGPCGPQNALTPTETFDLVPMHAGGYVPK